MANRFLRSLMLLLSLAILCVPLCASAEDFFEARASVFKAYGTASQPDVARLYHDTLRTARQTRAPGLLYRCAAFAELAGLQGEFEKTLVDILSSDSADPRFITYSIEALRSRGALAPNVVPILRASSKLDSGGRGLILTALSDAFTWSAPPAEVLSAVRKGIADIRSPSNAVVIALALASWGAREEASSALAARAPEKLPLQECLMVVNALNQVGDRNAARKAASAWFAGNYPAPAAPGATLEELLAERESALDPALQVAGAASAWDILLDRLAPLKARKDEPVIDASIALESVGRFVERAELFRRLYESRADADSAALYGNALIAAGDAYMTQTTLTFSVLSGRGLDDAPYLDLFDAVAVLRDPQVLLGSSSIFSITLQEPQVSRTISEYARLMGDFPLADRLFGSFIVESGLGRDTRFNWEGSRYLANYYLDTGRLDPGRDAARRAVAQLIDVQGQKQMTRSSQPARFVALFSRFGEVDWLLNHVRGRAKGQAASTILKIIERDACDNLGRWKDALDLTASLNAGERAPVRDAALAACMARAGETGQAITLYERALASDRNLPLSVHLALLDLYARDSRWQDAERFIIGPAGAGSPGAWLSLGDFYESHGMDEFAVRTYRRLDDLSSEIGPREFGGVIRFLSTRDVAAAASMLARRLSVQISREDKYEYLSECLPQKGAECRAYLDVGDLLRKGPLAADHKVLSLFYRLLSVRSARIRDFATALAAASQACAEDPRDIQNMQQMADLTLDARPARSADVTAAVIAALPLPSSFLKLASAEFALKRDASAASHFGSALDVPLSPSDAARVVRLLSAASAPRGLAARAAKSVSSAWSWVLVAGLADAALRSGDPDTAARLAVPAGTSGPYAGRALWLADFHVRAGSPTDALADIALGMAQTGGHPAFTIAEVDRACAAGSLTAAADALSHAAGRGPRPQFAALFRLESARITARMNHGGDK